MARTTRSILFITISMFFFSINEATNTSTLPKFSAILVFGDSTVDTGNNNFIPTLLRANRFPYGKDFAGHNASGRFSNGKLVPDIVASFLGIKEAVPPFFDPNLSDNDIRTGVVFASAGTGYDDLTARISNVIPFSKQIEMFKNYIARLKVIAGEKEAKKIIANSLVIISAGTNDFAVDFYDLPLRGLRFNISGYQDFILSRLRDFVLCIYKLGARNMAVTGLPPVGCLPIQMTAKFKIPVRKCLEKQNSDSRDYNNKLAKLLPQIQAKLNGSKVLYADIYKPLNEVIENPGNFGFVETKRGCCGTGLLEAAFLCNIKSPLCANASQYVFFDSLHPTEATYTYMAESLVKDLLSKFLGH